MSYNTYDRFQGCWWGANIAQSLLARSNRFHNSDYSQPWLLERQKIAVILLEREVMGDVQKFVADLPPPTTALQHNSSLLSWLPLIIFAPDSLIVGLKEMLQRLDSVQKLARIGVSSNILKWEYLVTTALNTRLDSITQERIIEEIDRDRQSVSRLAVKLKLVFEAIAKGSSLNLIMEKLSTMKESESSAIALAWYCFATTPLDFQLSVRRAALVPSKLAWLTIALTGTLSGAYNGMTEISTYSRNRHNQEQLEHSLCQKLFADWLGILNYQSNDRAYNPNLVAIAPTRVIQPRQNLKIISQISTLK